MSLLYNLRRLYGDNFVTEFPDGLIVPWKLLSIGDYLKYDQLYQSGRIPPAVLEDEIFHKCVLDPLLITQLSELRAGTVSVVAQQILTYSAPQSPQDVQLAINIQRHIHQNNIFHQMIVWICTAFPAYKPEDLYAMNYPVLMLRLAQAEEKLLRSGLINVPFEFFNTNEGEQQQKPKNKRKEQPIESNIENEKLKEIFDKQMQQTPTRSQPVVTNTQKQTIITKADMVESTVQLLGHEKDEVVLDKQAKETAQYYQHYLDQMARGESVKILTVEERLAIAKTREEANRKDLLQKKQEQVEHDKIELEKLKRIKEQEKKRKSKRRI